MYGFLDMLASSASTEGSFLVWEISLIIFFSFLCFLWGCGIYSLLATTTFAEKLQAKAKYILGFIFLGIYVISFVEVKSWHEAFVSTGSRPEWTPLISGADLYYYLYYSINSEFKEVPLNVYGPSFYLKFFANSFLFSSLFLLGCELALLKEWLKTEKKKFWLFLFLALTNPWILIQFTSVSKEIFILLALFSFLIFRENKKKTVLMASIVFAFFSRAEFFIAYTGFLFVRRIKFVDRKWQLLGLILLVTAFYNSIPGILTKMEVLEMHHPTAKFGVTHFLSKMCTEYFLFPLTIVPRVFLTIFEKTKGFIFSGNEIESYLSFIIDVSSEWIFFLTLIIALFKKKIYDLKKDNSYFFWIFIIMVSTVPFPVFRYIVPIYIIMLTMI